MDSGNTALAANWRRMIDHTNQPVVPVTAIEDRTEAARRPATFVIVSSQPIATPKSSGVATTARRQAVTMAHFSTVTDTRHLRFRIDCCATLGSNVL
jgi:hypothetical protein